MHNHTDCICLTFLHCAFSNVPSKRQLERMHNHTGCICLTFLHCVFSNVSSNGLPERMHNRIGCICLSFLHCVFSNVSSKHLHKRMHNHTGCICLTFPHCAFSNWIDLFLLLLEILHCFHLKHIDQDPSPEQIGKKRCLLFQPCFKLDEKQVEKGHLN